MKTKMFFGTLYEVSNPWVKGTPCWAKKFHQQFRPQISKFEGPLKDVEGTLEGGGVVKVPLVEKTLEQKDSICK